MTKENSIIIYFFKNYLILIFPKICLQKKLIFFFNYYPFLYEIWDIYEEFDEYVNRDREYTLNETICNVFTRELDNDKEKHHDLCMKLARNFKKFCNNEGQCKPNPERCYNLNNWINNLIKSKNLNIGIIKDIFASSMHSFYGSSYENICPFYSYAEIYKEPIKVIMLNIFHSNINIIREKLLGNIDSIYCSCRKYVKEVVEIYKYMKNSYCSKDNSVENEQTCNELDKFKVSYNQYLYNEVNIHSIIPSLEDSKPIKLLGCESDETIRGTDQSESIQASQQHINIPTSKDTQTNNLKSSISPTVSTALGTMAGASSIVALLYKVHTKFHLNI
ncbi:hypothetical protein PVMG_04566 [Plasmodium vivax Mauritania I]|uniref:Uncharacterized protein n=1 Tax=Plasmodium vivax Mauritania I TaxID=1035515 RepID=A0A0J9T3Z5_PLAVI|nr:hypothetical protein PVMG_04566 [Plasmodium vivax Mauritania I]